MQKIILVSFLISCYLVTSSQTDEVLIRPDSTLVCGDSGCIELECDIIAGGLPIVNPTYFWSTGETSEFITVCPGGQDSMLVWVEAYKSNGDTIARDTTFIITINKPALPPGTATTYTICKDSCVMLNAPVEGDNFLWDPWQPDSGLDDFSIRTPTACPAESKKYIVYYEYSVCEFTDTFHVMVVDTCVDEPDDTTGMAASFIKKSMVNIYPNPSENGVYTIQYSGSNEYVTVKVMDILGSLILNRDIFFSNKKNEVIDLSAYTKGNYLLQIENTPSGRSQHIRLLYR